MDAWSPIAAGPVGKLLSEFNASEVDQARKSRPFCRKACAVQEGLTVGGGQFHTYTHALSSNTQSFSSLVWCACKKREVTSPKSFSRRSSRVRLKSGLVVSDVGNFSTIQRE